LVVHRLKEGPAPRFRDISRNMAKYRGLHVVYSAQCPMLPKSVNDLSEMAAQHGLKLKVTALDNGPAGVEGSPRFPVGISSETRPLDPGDADEPSLDGYSVMAI
jgi:hypothetical protein